MDGDLAPSENNDRSLANLKPWPKGVSGNPGGRAKAENNFRDKCREHTDEALETLLGVMRKEKAMSSAKVQAARTLLSYAWGAPKGQDDDTHSNLIINILKLAVGNEPTTINAPAVRIERMADA